MLTLSMATSYYDRIAPLYDGRVTIEGCDIQHVLIDAPGEIFHRAFKFEEFDITELSLSSHIITMARGNSKYVAIPAFPLRMFRHSGIYIRTDRGIKGAADLRGKTIGLPEYQQTANVWIRGTLQDEYGIDANAVHWRTGGRDEPGREERTDIQLSKDVDWQVIPSNRTLSDMLEKGEIDALISPRPPQCFARKDKCNDIDYLFPDYPAVELEYFKRTQIFPIMHVVGVRRTLVEQYPWLPASVLKAFSKAKDLVDLRNSTILPWANAEYKRMQSLLGDDYWSYHLKPNEHVLTAFIRYMHAQGLIDELMAPSDLFAPSSLQLAKA